MINAVSRAEFVKIYGHLFEHSPWVVECAWDQRPFADAAALHKALTQVVLAAPAADQLALIRAHPELGVKAALTAESESEQAGAGLKNLSQVEYKKFAALNAAYKAKFGFPFIICARLQTKAAILAGFETRLLNDSAAEHAQALQEIFKITWLRLQNIKQGALAC